MKPGEDQNHNQPHHATSGRPWFSSKKILSSPSPSGSSSSTRRTSSDSQLVIHLHPSPLPQQEEILTRLKSMSVDKLRKLLANREAYNSFLLSLEPVKNQITISGELQEEVLNLARENSAKDSLVKELNDECEAMRSTKIVEMEKELAELEKQMEEIMEICSSNSMLLKLENAMHEGEEESECLKKQFLENEIEVSAFLQSYQEKRALYHKRDLLRLAAKTCGV